LWQGQILNIYKKNQWRPPSKRKEERRKKPKPEEQEGMPQHQHCPSGKDKYTTATNILPFPRALVFSSFLLFA
jgi:hypothetical protein